MRKTSYIFLLLFFPFFIFFASRGKNNSSNICHKDSIASNKSFWEEPMDGSIWDSIARDSIKHIWANETADYGLPFPIDPYEMCTKRYNQEPQSNISFDMIEGTWYGYGHLYDPIEILTLKNDGTYTLQMKPVIDSGENHKVRYGESEFICSGTFYYEEKRNELTLVDYYSEKDLIRADYIKYKNPRNEVMIVFSLDNDIMQLYKNIGDCFYYYRSMLE